MTAGRVGRPHGQDGSFYVEVARHPLAAGTAVRLAERVSTVERRAGTDKRPLVRLSGVEDPGAHRGEPLLVEVELAADEWLASDLVGCEVVPKRGRVARVVEGPSCSLLELEDGTLIPFVSDAIRAVEGDEIVVDENFFG